MKRIVLERYLRTHGCTFLRHGSGHDIWRSPDGTRQTSMPRHRVLARGTVRSLCRQLGLPFPF
ncbi:MAG: type II toxin-antitoxin system HicA family toxin [Planctomycetes bacterium]|nr:type II toxin-antitoxin system HicA family toxin [Planctomycetota bacterium]